MKDTMVLKMVMEICNTDADDDGGRGAACVGHVGAVMVVILIGLSVFVAVRHWRLWRRRCWSEVVVLADDGVAVGGRTGMRSGVMFM